MRGFTDFRFLVSLTPREIIPNDLQESVAVSSISSALPNPMRSHAWDETIPPITAVVFNQKGNLSAWVCELLTGNPEIQPTAQQIGGLKASIAVYNKWDQILEAFRVDIPDGE